MFVVEEFIEVCSAALGEPKPLLAVKQVVERAVRERGIVEQLSDSPGVRVLHCDPALTVAHVVIAPDSPRSLPHDHRMWAVVGIAAGREDSQFFRRSPTSLEPMNGMSLDEGQALAMGPEVIHAIRNPLSNRITSALHVYGGDLMHVERSMWTKPDWSEERYDALRATGTTFVVD